ncbi:LVIVD repeat-containing protein [Edaphobacter flagellatus]|uniref:hypothetical protein n=1 Tax=Edaphobacter flagellatus TaxID=1933044 RepID=UPI0021B3FFA6|nr:hypothetical protein [Edaphobacter flagellatus]
MNTPTRYLAASLILFATLAVPTLQAEILSSSKDLVVLEPRDLPELTRTAGDALLLHSDNAGRTYLYIEQLQGKRLTILNVTDPARIKVASSVALTAPSAFDFIKPLGAHTELVRFRNDHSFAIFDMQKSLVPQLQKTALINLDGSEPLGITGLLTTHQTAFNSAPLPREYQIVDTSVASRPATLATVEQVQARLTNGETGTTFLLGEQGLTVIRQLPVEEQYKVHQMQM